MCLKCQRCQYDGQYDNTGTASSTGGVFQGSHRCQIASKNDERMPTVFQPALRAYDSIYS